MIAKTKKTAGSPGKRSLKKRKAGKPLAGRIKSKWKDTVNAAEEALRDYIRTVDVKKMLIRNIPYFITFYLVEKEAWLYRHCMGDSIVQRLTNLFLYFSLAFKDPFPSFFIDDMAVGIAGAAALKLIIQYRLKNAKKYRHGVEYGSARWGTEKDIKPFIDPVFENNIILTKTEFLTMNSRPKKPQNARNKNVLVIGGSGSGKTRFFVKPNLMQMGDHMSYVVTDPKVEVFKVKVESTVIAITKAVSKSMCSQLYFFVERRNMLERRKVAL